jgi:hypothetical protein
VSLDLWELVLHSRMGGGTGDAARARGIVLPLLFGVAVAAGELTAWLGR